MKRINNAATLVCLALTAGTGCTTTSYTYRVVSSEGTVSASETANAINSVLSEEENNVCTPIGISAGTGQGVGVGMGIGLGRGLGIGLGKGMGIGVVVPDDCAGCEDLKEKQTGETREVIRDDSREEVRDSLELKETLHSVYVLLECPEGPQT